MVNLYRGFSTVNRPKKYRLTNFELCKQDLLNYFNIRKGSKLMSPEFGTIIWDMLFEPLTEGTKSTIINDIKKVVSYDPRISVSSVVITEFEHGLQIELDLTYVQDSQTEKLYLQFSRDAKKVNTL